MMDKQFNFEFEGYVTDIGGRVVLGNFSKYTYAVSAKKALSQLNYAAKLQLGASINDTKYFLTGKLLCKLGSVNLTYNVSENVLTYPTDGEDELHKYTYELSTGQLKLDKTATLPLYSKLFNIFGTQPFSREQFLSELFNIKDERVQFARKLEHKQLSFFDLTQLNRASSDTYTDDEDVDWVWDEDEGVYWKNGIKYGEYLTSLED